VSKTVSILPDVTGLNCHLSLNQDGACSLSNTLVADDWCWSNEKVFNSLRHIARATNTKISEQPPKSHVSAWEAIGVEPPWSQALPPHLFKAWLQKFTRDLLELRDRWADSYYGREFQVQQRLLQKLQQPFIDPSAIKKIDDDRIRAFDPNAQGLAPKSTYDIWSSVTGRMSIESGPNILTLDKKYRRIFKSRFTDGEIIQIDFSSLEPNTFLAMQGKSFESDAYAWVASQIDIAVPREVLKVAVMSALYGMSPSNFAKKFADIPDANELLFQVRDAFGFVKMTKHYREQLDAEGHITNHFGRIIKCDKTSPLVAHAVQSTAVDIVCQGFATLLDEFELNGMNAVPLYLIHDALMLDVTPGAKERIKARLNSGVHIVSLGCTMPLKLKTIDA
jgi:hypothetical protein